MSSTARGNAAENYVAEQLEGMGYVVGSRRHRRGGGDNVAVHPDPLSAPLGTPILVEVKKCKRRGNLFSGGYFSKEQRQLMRETPLPVGGRRFLAWVTGSSKRYFRAEFIPETDWPS